MNEEETRKLKEHLQDLKAILNHGGSYPMEEKARQDINDEIEFIERQLGVRRTNPWAWS